MKSLIHKLSPGCSNVHTTTIFDSPNCFGNQRENHEGMPFRKTKMLAVVRHGDARCVCSRKINFLKCLIMMILQNAS